MSNLAYEIGGVFLLAALFMYGTMVRGVLPDIFSDAKILAIAGGLIVVGLAAYSWSRQANFGLPSMFTPSSETHHPAAMPVESTAPAVRQPAITREPAVPRIVIRDAPSALPVKIAASPPEPAKAIDASPSVPAPALADPSGPVHIVPDAIDPSAPRPENRVKRVAKSVGGFLHIGRKKPELPADEKP